jgi:hypothetical protein
MMADTAKDLAMHYVPSMRQRFWRKIGYRYHLGEEPEGTDVLAGWMRTDVRLSFNWRDRLLLLLTGKLFIASIVSMDTPSPSICKTRVDWRIVEPGGDWR